MPPDEPTGENPPAGAIIDYYLPQDAKGAVTLEILDGQGKLVRRYRADDPPEVTEAELKLGLVPPYWTIPHRALPGKSGMHRWVWDLHHTAPAVPREGFPISAIAHATPRLPLGPMAVAGDYTVRLIVDGKTSEQTLTVLPDPRVKATAGALRQQLDLGLTLSDLMGRGSKMMTQAQAERADLKGGKPGDPAIGHLDAKLKELLDGGADADEGLVRTQRNLGQLYTQVTDGAAAPTTAQGKAVHAAGEQLAEMEGEWKEMQGEISTINKSLPKKALAALHAAKPPPTALFADADDDDDDDNPDE
jgi:hypothetical protein